HPANPMISAELAYYAEISRPPEFQEAFRFTNQTLYLAPTWAEEHLAAGRLLVRIGKRAQGFESMRRAWALADSERQRGFIRQIAMLARSPDEVFEAIPRRDEVLDVADEEQLAIGARELVLMGRRTWANDLFGRIESID